MSVFDPSVVEPPLTLEEILDAFRPGSNLIARSVEEIEGKGLRVVPIIGAESLPERLRIAHAEIRPAPQMIRAEFKQALRGLE